MEGAPGAIQMPPAAEARTPEVRIAEAREIVRAFPSVAERAGAGTKVGRAVIRDAQSQDKFAEGSAMADLAVAPEGERSVLDRAGVGGEEEAITGSLREDPLEARQAQSDMIQARMQVLARLSAPTPGKEAEGDTPAVEPIPGDPLAAFALDVMRDEVVVEIPADGGAKGQIFTLQEWKAHLDSIGPVGSPERQAVEKQGLWNFQDEAPEEPVEEKKEQNAQGYIDRERDGLVKRITELRKSKPEKTGDKAADREAAAARRAEIAEARQALRSMAIASEAHGAYGGLIREQVLQGLRESGQITISDAEMAQITAEGADRIPRYSNGEAVPLTHTLRVNGASEQVIAMAEAVIGGNKTFIEALTDAKLGEEMRQALVEPMFAKSDKPKDIEEAKDNLDLLTTEHPTLLMLKKLSEKGRKNPLLMILLALGLNLTTMILDDLGVKY